MLEKGITIIKLSQASSLAKVISNKTAQQIIEHIGSSKKITASQIAKSLDLPASTVHYNIKALVKGGIVDDSQFTYSSKGKTIIHYALTNNILVIIPESQDEFSMMNTIKSIKALVPSLIGVALLGLGYALFSKNSTITPEAISRTALSADYATAPMLAEGEAAIATKAVPILSQTATSSSHEFLWGLFIAATLITIIFLIKKYIDSKKREQ